MLRTEVYARALRASENVKGAEFRRARDAPDGWAGRVRERKAPVWRGVNFEVDFSLCGAPRGGCV